MKRLSLITVLLLVAICAKSQIVPHYGETYTKSSGKLRGKAWMSELGFRQESPDENGNSKVIIYRLDSAKVFILDMEKKTWLAFQLSQVIDGALSGISAFERESHNVKRTFINEEVVEGKTCNHYRVETATALKGGTTDYANWEEWIHEPTKIWYQRTDEINPGGYLVHRNVVIGAQPARLFEIPKDFKGMDLPVGGMLELITGKSKAENQQAIDDMKAKAEDLGKKMNEAHDPNKSTEQQLQDMLKLMNESTKKK